MRSLAFLLLLPMIASAIIIEPIVGSGTGKWDQHREGQSYIVDMHGAPFSVTLGVRGGIILGSFPLLLEARKSIHTFTYNDNTSNPYDNQFTDVAAFGKKIIASAGYEFGSKKTSILLHYLPVTALTIIPSIDQDLKCNEHYRGTGFGASIRYLLFQNLSVNVEYIVEKYTNIGICGIEDSNPPLDLGNGKIIGELTKREFAVMIGIPFSIF